MNQEQPNMRKVTHLFDTVDERDAFEAGVDWVNDSALGPAEYFVSGDEASGITYGLVYRDQDGDGDTVIDHQK